MLSLKANVLVKAKLTNLGLRVTYCYPKHREIVHLKLPERKKYRSSIVTDTADVCSIACSLSWLL